MDKSSIQGGSSKLVFVALHLLQKETASVTCGTCARRSLKGSSCRGGGGRGRALILPSIFLGRSQ